MPDLFVYLIKVNIVLALFYLAYRFLLRPLTFYTLNRVFLVFGIVFSTAYPFVDLSTLFEKNREFISPQLVSAIPDWQPDIVPASIVQNNAVPVTETFNYWIIPEAIFWLGILIMSIRLIIQLISLYRLHRRSTAKTAGEHTYRDVSESVNPFSFLRNIYLNTEQLKPAELKSVLEHEQVHVREWHTLDVLLSELNIIFYWFNPGAWLMKKAVKENLEFIADYRILQQGADGTAYQYDLLNVGLLKHSSPLVNHFSLLTIKNRIVMMNKKRSSRLQFTKYLLALPLVLILATAFTVSKTPLTGKDRSENPNIKPVSTHGTISSGRADQNAKTESSSALNNAITVLSEILIPLKDAPQPANAHQPEDPASVLNNTPNIPGLLQDTARYLINGKRATSIVDGKPVNDLRSLSGTLQSTYRITGEAATRVFGPAYSDGASLMVTEANSNLKEVQDIKKQLNPATDIEMEMLWGPNSINNNSAYPIYRGVATIKQYAYGEVMKYISQPTSAYLTLADGSKFEPYKNLSAISGPLYFINGKEVSKTEAESLPKDQVSYISICVRGWGMLMRETTAAYKLSQLESKFSFILITTRGAKDEAHDLFRQVFREAK